MRSLLRRLLREHRLRLPRDLRGIGDAYVLKEFRDHRDVKDAEVLSRFREGWEAYLEDIRGQTKSFGANMPEDVEMSDDQRQKFRELKKSSDELGAKT